MKVVPFAMIHGGIVPIELLAGHRFGPSTGAVKFSVHSPSPTFNDTAKLTLDGCPEFGTQVLTSWASAGSSFGRLT